MRQFIKALVIGSVVVIVTFDISVTFCKEDPEILQIGFSVTGFIAEPVFIAEVVERNSVFRQILHPEFDDFFPDISDFRTVDTFIAFDLFCHSLDLIGIPRPEPFDPAVGTFEVGDAYDIRNHF